MGNYLLEHQESERLYYRKLTGSDLHSWLPFYHDPDSTKYWNGLPKDAETACKEQFQSQFERYEKGWGGMNALISMKTGNLVGMCGLLLQTVDGTEELEIGYSILPQHRQKGYAFEAAQKCKQFAFEHRLAESLISIIQVANIPSQKVALKNGMTLDKTTMYKNNQVYIFRVSG